MADREWIEILAIHADKLNVGANEEAEYLATLPEHQDTLQPLLTVARKVKDALAPVEPDPAFCENLPELGGSNPLVVGVSTRAQHTLPGQTKGTKGHGLKPVP